MAKNNELEYALRRAEALAVQEARHSGRLESEMDALRSDLAEAERRAFEHGESAKISDYLLEQAQGEAERLGSALEDAQAKVAELEADLNRIHIVPTTKFGHRPGEETK